MRELNRSGSDLVLIVTFFLCSNEVQIHCAGLPVFCTT